MMMFSWVYQFLLAQWRHCIALIAQAPQLLLRFHHSFDPSLLDPLTPEQRARAEDDFISALDQDAVCALASEHRGLPCCVLHTKRGSFNICYFIGFDTDHPTWIVRIPIPPAVHQPWEKLRSEVFTMRSVSSSPVVRMDHSSQAASRYIRENSYIPVPEVYAHGRQRLRRDDETEQAFMIVECMQGRPLDEATFLGFSEDCRRRFYSELIDVLAQLRKLDFSAGGSLVPASDDLLKPTVVGAFSISINELQMYGHPFRQQRSETADQSLAEQLRVLWDTYLVPTSDLRRSTGELELLALHTIKTQMHRLQIPFSASKRFILSHTDLRCPNILVDDELHIRGIIDWEWSGTVPQPFFTPPAWITHKDLSVFRTALRSRENRSISHSQLVQEWADVDELTLHFIHILREPLKMLTVFYNFIYPAIFDKPREQAVAQFFQGSGEKAELEKRLRDSERYTNYLKENGLFVVDEKAQRMREWIEKAQKLLAK